MNRQLFAICVFLAFAVVACGGGSKVPTYSISGTVTLNGVGYEGVTMTLEGDAARSTTTDSDGNYSFGKLEDGFYIVTPSLSANGYSQNFSPFSLFPNISGAASTGNDFELDSYEINGTVTMDGEGYPGVTVNLDGAAVDTTTSGADGFYSFSVLRGSYTVTAALAGQTLTPAGYSPVIDDFDDTNNDFALDIYTITGDVTLGGFGYEGAVVNLSGDASRAFTTDGSGSYTFTVLNGTYNVTPAITGQTLSPLTIAAIAISGASSGGNDFTVDTHVISGHVTLNGGGYDTAPVHLSGTALSGEVYDDVIYWTESDGSYSFTVLNGTYTVTPIVAGQSLTPTERAVTVAGTNMPNRDFALNTYSISGQILFNGTGYADGATVNLSGDLFTSTVSNGSGNYTFTGLLNGAYNVAPQIAGQSPSPADRDITIANSSSVDNDFVLGANTITGKVTLNGVGYPGVTITLSGDDSGTYTTGASGNYTIIVLNGDYVVTPSLVGQTLTPTSQGPLYVYDDDATDIDFALDTTTLSGTVTLNGEGYPGVAVSLVGTKMSGSTTTDEFGDFSFDVINDTNFTLTPSLAGQTLVPASQTGIIVADGNPSPGHDFTLQTWPISGKVTLLGSPYEGATVNLTGSLTDSTTTNASGDYTLNVINGTYTVTPEVDGQTLNPTSIASIVMASAADTGNDFAINTFDISGKVSLTGSGYSGVTVDLMDLSGGGDDRTTTTNGTGNYTFADLLAGNYQVIPSVNINGSDQAFDNDFLDVLVTTADRTGIDFNISTFSVTGAVTLGGSPYASAQLVLTGDASKSTSTNGSGQYAFTEMLNGSYVVTPVVSAYGYSQTFTPSEAYANVTGANSTGNNFAMDTYSIGGQIRLNGSGYTGTASVGIVGGGINTSTSTSGGGNFTFSNLLVADYDITPNVSNQTLTPTDMTINGDELPSSGNIFDLNTYSLSGQVTLGPDGYAGATVNLTGAATASTTTPASGDYTFDGLLAGNYTLTPLVSGQSLTPSVRTPSITNSNISGLDFALNTWSISGNVTHGTADLEGIQLNLTGKASKSTTTAFDGSYSFTDLLGGSYTVTPVAVPQVFDPTSDSFSLSSNRTGVDFDIPSLIWLVNAASTAPTPNGFSWVTAYPNLPIVGSKAVSGDQVWVAKGTYEDGTNEVLAMNAGVKYYGGFAGSEASLGARTYATMRANPTILDGLGTSPQIVLGASNSRLDGFIIKNADPVANDSSFVAPINAAGVVNFSLINCIVASNVTTSDLETDASINSSALNIQSGLVLNTVFKDNLGRNGPIYVVSGSSDAVDIVNTEIYGNKSLFGGGMVLDGNGPVRVLNTTIFNNNTCAWNSTDGYICEYPYLGRGIWIDSTFSSTIDITNTTVCGDIDSWGGTPGATWVVPTISYSILEAFATTYSDGSDYQTVFAGTNVMFATTDGLNYNPQFLAWAYSGTDPLYNGNYAGQLQDTSACIDAGDSSAIPSSIDFDLLGEDRFNGTVDIGAYEFWGSWSPGDP